MSDNFFKYVLKASGIIIILLALGILVTLLHGSLPAIKEFGIKFIFSSDWIPREDRESYGALPFIIGTLSTSILALIIAIPFAMSISLLLGFYFRTGLFNTILRSLSDLLAGVPSVVYGLWGFYTIKPLVVYLGLNSQGYGIFTSSIVLAVMIIPFAASISTEVISMISNELKEAGYSLGATKIEVVRHVIIPNAFSGIIAGFILAFGRALGETMAVTMLVGNSNRIPSSLFDMGNTMASLIANQFGEADGIKLHSLIEIGLLLFIITGIVNFFGKWVMKRMAVR
ncbi:MAG: phosphate ABC transporter permease subunit PstC [Candidatus Delongbacteria bacterium]|nr:phosphate ABC transporter permease subunit PstC [Candidatus Delongbacteria bacterium]MBN2835496.1 phosphate ABC transporter permease subunit PstC [Candidatus Delongbacteria bacterium]